MFMGLAITHTKMMLGNPTNGATTGPHLHFTVKKGSTYIDPMSLF
jgi:murein DD-endopeptidase MepM/ murein hydrolase activator NlpD